MKNGILIKGAILLLTAGSAWSAEVASSGQDDKYRANELSVDLFGSASIGQQTINHFTGERISHDARLGAGGGLNYFFCRNIGIGGEAYTENAHHNFIDTASGSLIGRFPLGKSGVAPYVFGGGGRQFDPIYLWYLHAGAGLEVRFTPHVGAFVDARYVFTDGTKNYGLGRAGLRIAF
jgi:hypothetical protein